ncbi:phospholipase [Sporolactobacillus sp. THM7-4]|nr:phospholipase [Sporolactobacillus sp. THM7-4]
MNAVIITLSIIPGLIILILAAVLLDIYIGYRVRHPLAPDGLSATGSNRITYFTNGRDLFNAMKESMENAQHHIHMSFFIFKTDHVGQDWLNLLKKKASEGVSVRLLVDYFNGSSVRKEQMELKQAGVRVAFSGRPRFPFTFYYLNRRNHRKITVIDGKIGYFGGFNVSREYIGLMTERGPWHDNHLKVEGESVRDLQHLFLDDWCLASGEKINGKKYFPEPVKGSARLTLLGTNGKQIEDVFAEKLGSAQKSIVIASPYFIPSRLLLHVLIDRLNNGVALKILLPIKRDHPFVKPASFLYFQPLVEKGARVYHFYPGFYHAKLFVVDQKLCYIGTANFDQRSFFWNDELSSFTEDQELIGEVMDPLNKDIREHSITIDEKKIRSRSPVEKLKSICSGWLSPFL